MSRGAIPERILEGKMVKLRPVLHEDITQITQWRNDPETHRYFVDQDFISMEQQEKWFLGILKAANEKTDFWFLISAVNDIALGVTSLKHIDWENSHAEWSLYIGEVGYRKRGHAVEAALKLLDFGFLSQGFHRIYCYVMEENEAAIALNRRLGFQEEGKFRAHVLHAKKFHNLIVMGLLKAEYLAKRDGLYSKIDFLTQAGVQPPGRN